MNSTNTVSIDLPTDEALVLFAWLTKVNKDGALEFDDQAEARVLWNLESALEAVLVQPLDQNYDQLLMQARTRVRDNE